MAIILTFRQKDKQIKEIFATPGRAAIFQLGSGGDHLDIYFDDQFVSRSHAQILVDQAGMIYVSDLGSTNGTYLNGKRVTANQPYLLRSGDKVVFGKESSALMQVEDERSRSGHSRGANGGYKGGHSQGRDQDGNTPPPVADQTASILDQLKQKKVLTLGRHKDCDIVLDYSMVSRQHAVLKLLPDGKVQFTDQSTNGSYLNGKRIHKTSVTLKKGDVLIVGRARLDLEQGACKLASEIAIKAVRIKKQFRNGKVGLHTSSLNVPSGSLLAIMGPSGCGKSTLLRCLTGESPATRGSVYLLNLELIRNYDLLKSLVGYVPQDDIVHKELTVEQSLYFAGKLRMEDATDSTIEQKISEVLARLHISDIRKSPIAKISGGQRKRVSIAVELLTDPLILFMDEPTSPLDPQTIEEFMRILQELAESGTTVVMVTHKPEDLEFMDSVIFMAQGGHLSYHGSVGAYKSYFGVKHAVGVYANLTGQKSHQWITRFNMQQSGSGQQGDTGSNSQGQQGNLRKRSNKPVFNQLYWLSMRNLRIKVNDTLNAAILLGQAPIIAALICIIFDEIYASVPFIVTLSAAWFGTSNAAREIVAEAAIYRRERMFNLRIGPYIFSKLAVLSLFSLIQAILFIGIIFLRYSQNDPVWNNFLGTMLWFWAITICSTVLGLMLSALVNTTEKVMTLVPLVLIPQVMLAGVVTSINNFLVEFMSFLTPTRWGNEGLTLIQDRVMREVTVLNEGNPESFEFPGEAEPMLRTQFTQAYEDIFGELAYTISLDAIMLSGLTLVMMLVLVGAMRRKDAIY